MDGMLVEHLGVAPAVQETLDLKVKLVKKGSQPLEGGESHSLRQLGGVRPGQIGNTTYL
jgi:hypothetical protein